MREVQTELRGDEISSQSIGVAIDVGLVNEDLLAASMPFVLLAVVGILALHVHLAPWLDDISKKTFTTILT